MYSRLPSAGRTKAGNALERIAVRSCCVYSAVAKKNVRSFTIGPPREPEYWRSASGMSTGLIAESVDGVTQLSTDGAQKPLVENRFACRPPMRLLKRISPCVLFVPDFVTMLSAGPDVHPYSAVKAFESTVTSCTAPTGTTAIIVCRPHASSLLAPSSVNV